MVFSIRIKGLLWCERDEKEETQELRKRYSLNIPPEAVFRFLDSNQKYTPAVFVPNQPLHLGFGSM
jgi:hypothetical protein